MQPSLTEASPKFFSPAGGEATVVNPYGERLGDRKDFGARSGLSKANLQKEEVSVARPGETSRLVSAL
jgi:hypothetical protein